LSGRKDESLGILNDGRALAFHNVASGVTSKAANGGHFKTGQRRVA